MDKTLSSTIQGLRLPPGFRKYVPMIPGAILVIAVLLLFGTSWYTVAQDEVAVVQRLGRYARTETSGLHFKLPLGIETANKVRVEYVYKEEFGFSTSDAQKTRSSATVETSQMLTGDLNIADVGWIVQFKIADPVAYLFKVRDVQTTLRNVSEAVMRRVVGDRSVTEVLTVARADIATVAEQEMQALLDEYETGIAITTVQLKDVNPPESVKASFNEVNEARQEKERTTNQAWEAYNKAIPEAEGAALRAISAAEGYAIDRVNRANGDAQRFTAVLKEYRRAPEVTRRRLYLEAMMDVLPLVQRKYIVDERMQGVLPLLDLGRTPALSKEAPKKP